MLKKTAQKGFTIVELLIVIVVIGILAALVLNTFSGVQKRARDSDRQNDITQLATQLEVYYNDFGTYPTAAQLQDEAPTGWVKTNLKGLDLAALYVQGQATTDSTITATATPTINQYGYVTTPAACTGSAGVACTTFKLYYQKEQNSTTVVKDSLN